MHEFDQSALAAIEADGCDAGGDDWIDIDADEAGACEADICAFGQFRQRE